MKHVAVGHATAAGMAICQSLIDLRSARLSASAMDATESDYFYRRAEEEIAIAQASAEEHVVRFHYHLAGLYLDKVYGTGSPAIGHG